MKKKDDRTIEERAIDFEHVMTLMILNNIRSEYKTLENFRNTYSGLVKGALTADDQVRFCYRFGFDTKTVRKLLGKVDGRYVTIREIEPHLNHLNYRRAFNKRYASGKTYTVRSYWYLDFDSLAVYFADENMFNCAYEGFYSKRQRDMFCSLKFKKEKEMTKKEKQDWQAKYDRGETCMTPDEVERLEAKRKRSNDKRKMTIAAKAARNAIGDFAAMMTEIEMLKGQVGAMLDIEARIAGLEDENARLRERLSALERPSGENANKTEQVVVSPSDDLPPANPFKDRNPAMDPKLDVQAVREVYEKFRLFADNRLIDQKHVNEFCRRFNLPCDIKAKEALSDSERNDPMREKMKAYISRKIKEFDL